MESFWKRRRLSDRNVVVICEVFKTKSFKQKQETTEINNL